MKKIRLTQVKFAIVNNKDFETINKMKWQIYKNGKYARNSYAVPMQNFIMRPPFGFIVDHKNGDGLDNRRRNLRLCTRSQNCRNRNININHKSGFKGVAINSNGSIIAQIKIKGEAIYLGSFKTKEKAARAYDKAALRLFGAFARTNKMMGLLA